MSGAGDWARGIDVSWANRTTPTLTGRDFAFVRACYGTRADAKWAYHSANVRKAGAVLGAYAFGIYGDGAAQAAAFLAIAGTADLWALDLEKESGKPRMTFAQARAFIAAVQATGREIGLYHSVSGFPNLGQDWNWPAGGPGWDNRTLGSSTPPDMAWAIWQYRGYPLDLDYFHGDAAALSRFVKPPTGDIALPIYVQHPRPGTLTIAAGATVRGWTPRPDGTGWAVAKTWPAKPVPSSASFDAVLSRLSGTSKPTSLLRVTSGYFAGLYVSSADVTEAFAPVPPTSNDVTVTLTVNGTVQHSQTY
jgi:hypothetical protein